MLLLLDLRFSAKICGSTRDGDMLSAFSFCRK